MFHPTLRPSGAALAAVLAAMLLAGRAPAEGVVEVPVGSEACKTCHAPHRGHQVRPYHDDCVACHALTDERHLEDGGKSASFPDVAACLACHRGRDTLGANWAFGDHGRAGLPCRECHGIHAPRRASAGAAGLQRTDRASALCLGCHREVALRLNMNSHHPVREGGMSCVDCHDPHGGDRVALVGRNDKCFECHQAIRGPKVFEHPPVVEDCAICHNPHGSPNRRLLQVAQPMQCLQCHPLASTAHARRGGGPVRSAPLNGAQLRDCVACHGAIHGSHVDAGLKY